MSEQRRCLHEKSFDERCIECEIVWAEEGLKHATEGVKLYSAAIKRLRADLATSSVSSPESPRG